MQCDFLVGCLMVLSSVLCAVASLVVGIKVFGLYGRGGIN
jgi:hypothetical protein